MPMVLKVRTLTSEEQQAIERLAHSRTASAREVERARIVWHASQGLRVRAYQPLPLCCISTNRQSGCGSNASTRLAPLPCKTGLALVLLPRTVQRRWVRW
jgi:hypothetical protein